MPNRLLHLFLNVHLLFLCEFTRGTAGSHRASIYRGKLVMVLPGPVRHQVGVICWSRVGYSPGIVISRSRVGYSPGIVICRCRVGYSPRIIKKVVSINNLKVAWFNCIRELNRKIWSSLGSNYFIWISTPTYQAKESSLDSFFYSYLSQSGGNISPEDVLTIFFIFPFSNGRRWAFFLTGSTLTWENRSVTSQTSIWLQIHITVSAS